MSYCMDMANLQHTQHLGLIAQDTDGVEALRYSKHNGDSPHIQMRNGI